MVTTFHKAYVAVVLAFVLLAGLVGGVMRIEMAPPLQHGTSIHLAGIIPNIPCPPPPFNCEG